jgi:hypothetical protein
MSEFVVPHIEGPQTPWAERCRVAVNRLAYRCGGAECIDREVAKEGSNERCCAGGDQFKKITPVRRALLASMTCFVSGDTFCASTTLHKKASMSS